MPDRANGCPADFANALCKLVCHCEDLIRMVIQEQMEVTEVRAGHVPVEGSSSSNTERIRLQGVH